MSAILGSTYDSSESDSEDDLLNLDEQMEEDTKAASIGAKRSAVEPVVDKSPPTQKKRPRVEQTQDSILPPPDFDLETSSLTTTFLSAPNVNASAPSVSVSPSKKPAVLLPPQLRFARANIVTEDAESWNVAKKTKH